MQDDKSIVQIDGKVCSRCHFDNARKKCSAPACSKYFHENCSKKRGFIKDDRFFCFECLYHRRKASSSSKEIDYNRVSRDWLVSSEQKEFEYVPQVGDFVVYFF